MRPSIFLNVPKPVYHGTGLVPEGCFTGMLIGMPTVVSKPLGLVSNDAVKRSGRTFYFCLLESLLYFCTENGRTHR